MSEIDNVRVRAYYKKNRATILEKWKVYSEANRTVLRERAKTQYLKRIAKIKQRDASRRELFPEKVLAKGEVNKAIKSGKLIPQPCEVCNKQSADAHHDDYSKPLSVRWLCRYHHKKWHIDNKT